MSREAYYFRPRPGAAALSLKKNFGINRVHELKPLIQHGQFYHLHNTHVDLQVRTLPHRRAIVASVSEDDEQHAILEHNAEMLRTAGQEVLRIENARVELPRERATQQRFFKSYTNALFLNGVVLIPAYGDEERDRAALAVYNKALNEGLPSNRRSYVVRQIPESYGVEAIEFSASIRCAARELHRSPPPGRR